MDKQKLSGAIVAQIIRGERQDKNLDAVRRLVDPKVVAAQDDRLFGVLTLKMHFRDGIAERIETKTKLSEKVAA